MPALRRARGTALAELLVALVLAGVVAATAATGLVQHLREDRERRAQSQADEIVNDAHDVLRAALGHGDSHPRLLGDTALEVASLSAFALSCDLSAGRVVFPATVDWWAPARTGDSVAMIDTLSKLEWRGTIASTGSQRPTSTCPSGGTRVTLAVPPPPTVPVDRVPARIWRIVRYVVYRASDGAWWMGARTCQPACGSVQPITGPFRAPSSGGWRMAFVLSGDARPVALDLQVRATVGGRTAALTARIPIAAVP